MKKYGGVELQLHAPTAITPDEAVPGTYRTGDWVIPRADMEVLDGRNLLLLERIELLTPRSSIP
jgi:hypothetical protein